MLLLLLSCKYDDDDPHVYGINNMYKNYILIMHICVCAAIPCSEGMFLNIFKDHIQRYSPARRFYLCSFIEEEGDETLRDLLGEEDWAIRHYGNKQYVYVDIVNSQVWKEVGLIEANGSSIFSSNIIISFSIDKGSQ